MGCSYTEKLFGRTSQGESSLSREEVVQECQELASSKVALDSSSFAVSMTTADPSTLNAPQNWRVGRNDEKLSR